MFTTFFSCTINSKSKNHKEKLKHFMRTLEYYRLYYIEAFHWVKCKVFAARVI